MEGTPRADKNKSSLNTSIRSFSTNSKRLLLLQSASFKVPQLIITLQLQINRGNKDADIWISVFSMNAALSLHGSTLPWFSGSCFPSLLTVRSHLSPPWHCCAAPDRNVCFVAHLYALQAFVPSASRVHYTSTQSDSLFFHTLICDSGTKFLKMVSMSGTFLLGLAYHSFLLWVSSVVEFFASALY